ncbi:LicD family protein [Bacteroides bouchesdurhonensis]
MKDQNSSNKKLQFALMQLLLDFDTYCKKHSLKYILAWGSTLGAVRHKGFIPWDDDLDVAMDLSDYKKLCELLKNDSNQTFTLQTHETESYYFNGFAKIRSKNTYIKEERINVDYKYNGIFIDVFPLEYNFSSLNLVSHVLYKPLFLLVGYPIHKYPIISMLANVYYGFVVLMNKIFRTISKSLKCKYYTYSYGTNCFTYKNRLKKSYIEDTINVEFEGYEFPIPREYDEYLKITYGDYMTLPKEKDRVSQHILELKL